MPRLNPSSTALAVALAAMWACACLRPAHATGAAITASSSPSPAPRSPALSSEAPSARPSKDPAPPRRLLSQLWNGCLPYLCANATHCRDVHHGMAHAVMAALDATNATWTPMYGTLLGLVRDQLLSPNGVHRDVDFAAGPAWFRSQAWRGSAFVAALAAQHYYVLQDEASLLRVCIGRGYPGLERDLVRHEGISYTDLYRYKKGGRAESAPRSRGAMGAT